MISKILKLYRMPHKCHGNANNCPSRSHPIWEMPINELDRRDDPSFDETLSGCHLVSSCSNVYERSQFRRLLEHNFNRHYNTNRAPLSLSFDTAWLQVNKGFTKELAKWMRMLLLDHSDVYFVTNLQVRSFSEFPNFKIFEYFSIFRSFNGCKIHLIPIPCVIFKSGRKSAISKVSPSVLCQILVP